MALVLIGGVNLGAVFKELLRAVVKTKKEAVGFSSILNRLQATIVSVFPIIEEIDELKKEANHLKEELEGLMKELNKGVDLVRKCSKVTWLNLYKRTKYTTKLQELDDYILRFFNRHTEVDRTTKQMHLLSDLAAKSSSLDQSVPASLQKEEKGVPPMLGKPFMPLKGSEKTEITEPSINRLEEGHPFVMQHHLGMTEPPNDGELVNNGSRLVFMQAGLGLTVPPKEEEWEEAEEIHLMDNEFSERPGRPMCPILSELYLQGNYKLRKIPSSFFEHMPALQVLNLSKTGIRSLPESLFWLVGLKKLFLNNCENFMMLSPKVGELKRLVVLNLEGTEIIDLPKEVEKLTNLKCLKVSFYRYMNHGRKNEQSNAMIHGGVISALSQLEELNIDVDPDDERWGVSVEAIIDEIRSLMQLRTLKLYFPGVELLRQFKWYSLGMVQPSLSHFRFIVGHHSKRIISRLTQEAKFEIKNRDRCLTYIYGEGVPEEIKKVLQYATAFYLDRHMTVKKLSEFGIENMEQLKCCIMGECKEIQVIIDGQDVHEEDHNREIVPESSSDKRIGLESLEYLNIYYMKNLRSIWKGPVHGRCFSLLKSLTLRTCPELTTIFTLFFLDNLCSLEELTIEDCPVVKSLVSYVNHSEHESSSSTRDYFLPKLKKISLCYVPELVSISNGVCIAPKLEWLAFYNCPNLKSLSIEEVCSTYLEMIVGEKDWWDALEWRNGRPDNLDGIFVPINADDLTNTMDNRHSSFLSPSYALKQKWGPSQQEDDLTNTMDNRHSSFLSPSHALKQKWGPSQQQDLKLKAMGGHMSKNKTSETTSTISINNKLQYTTELSSYEAACKLDADLQSFDTALQARTNQVINTLAVGVEVRALSFDSLKEVFEFLLEMNREVVKVILECKKDIWKNQELFDLVEEYFENSLQTLDFCTALEKCLKRARDSQLLILVAFQDFQQFEEEKGENGGTRYKRTLEELKNFKNAGDPFTEEFFQIFQSVYKQQMLMLEKLQLRKNKLDKKLKYIHAWRKVSSMIFVATFAAVLICSVVAAAMAAPPVAAALAAASSIPLGSMGKWIDSLWKNYEIALKGQKEIVNSMQVGTYVAIKDLDSIRVLIDRLEIEIESLLQTADFVIEEEAVKIAIDEIKKKLGVFMKSVEDLGLQADICSRDIRRARTVVLQRIIKHPNN